MEKYLYKDVYESTLKYFNGDELAASSWINKYSLKDSDNNYYEMNPDDMHKRIASELFRIESKYENGLKEEEIYELIKDFKYIIPQGSPMSGIGNNLQTVSLSNCFVVGNEADSYGGIFLTDQEQAQLMKRRGGVGHDLSHIRPRNTKVNNSALISTGIVPFMERFSNTTREVAQDGRRGALMLSCSIEHPNAENFIDAKLEAGKVTGANISVKITDEFMKSVIENKEYTQKFPVGSEKPTSTNIIDAKKLWDKIIHNAWKSAEPGVLFWDTIINESVADCYADLGFRTISTNPCVVGETLIAVADGRNAVSIKQLASERKDVPVYSTSPEGKVEIKWGRNPRKTGDKKEVWKLILDDESELIATPDHKIYLKNNTYKELKDLQKGDSISSFYSFDSNGGYRQIAQVGQKMVGGRFRNRRQYRVIHEFFNGTDIDYKLYSIHHKDFDNQNDSIENLELMPVGEHKHLHSDRIKGELNPYHRLSDEQKFAFASHPGEKNPKYIKVSNDELLKHGKILFGRDGLITKRSWIKYASENGLPQHLGNEFRFKTFSDFKNQVVDNHKVVSVEFYGYEDVYNITVDDNHNYNIITSFEDDKYVTSGGICVKNCGEIPLCSYDSCRLLCVNLYSYVIDPFTKNARFDFDLFAKHTQIAERFMDDIVDLEIEKIEAILKKIESDPEDNRIKMVEIDLWNQIMKKTIEGRRTGLGITAEGDMLAALNLTYGTPESTKVSVEIHKIFALNAYKSSCIMAQERGSFPIYDYEKELKNPFINRLRTEFPELDEMLKKGRRNISLLTCAPTGTVSLMTQTTSGIEPAFMVYYKRRRKINPNDKNAKSVFVDESGDHWEEYLVFHHKFLIWLEINGYDVEKVKNMSDDEVQKIVERSPYFKATSNDVDWVEKVKLQGAIQKWIDHSISVTINLPNTVTEELVSKVYETGWSSGCKGMTVYRDGSRSGVLISAKEETKEETEEKVNNPYGGFDSNAPKRPKSLKCDVVRFTNKGDKWIGFVGLHKYGEDELRPYEIFTGLLDSFQVPSYVESGEISKSKIDGISRYDFVYKDKDGYPIIMTGLNRAFDREHWNYGKMISGVLRHRMPIKNVVDLIDSLKFAEDNIVTWKAGVKRMLKKYIKSESMGEKCPNCGSVNYHHVGGCDLCADCGFSKKCS